MMEDLHKNGQVSTRFADFKGGVSLGLGTFNLVRTVNLTNVYCQNMEYEV